VIDEITEFSKSITSREFDAIIEAGKSLGIVSYNSDMDKIDWDYFPDNTDGKIVPLRDKNAEFLYFIEFADHSLSNDHIGSSIHEVRDLVISKPKPDGFWNNHRKKLLIICHHDEDATLLTGKINENFSPDSPAQSNYHPVFVIRWSDVVAAHNKKKFCYCGNGKEKIKRCISNYCEDCCWKECQIMGRSACTRRKETQERQDDFNHRHADGWR
tara:strand:- start:70 stop:711 length:642 start_codon:yes stop_codon:yes gene_type:complete